MELKGRIKTAEIEGDKLITAQQAAEVAGVTKPTIYAWLADGLLTAIKIDNKRYFFLDQVLEVAKPQMIREFKDGKEVGEKKAKELLSFLKEQKKGKTKENGIVWEKGFISGLKKILF